MKRTLLIFLSLLFTIQLFSQTSSKRFISFEGIGEQKICKGIYKSEWKFLRDSSSSGSGFEYYGKFFTNETGGIILCQLSLIDSTSIIQVSTTSKEFESYQGLKVGSSLSYLLEKFPDCSLTVGKNKNKDFFFSLVKESRRIDFHVDYIVEEEVRKLDVNEYQKAHEVLGLRSTLNRLGKQAAIKEITVLSTSICQ